MNCLIIDDEEMSRNLVKYFVDQTDILTLVGVCSSAIEAANILKKQKIDLLLLDVEMPQMTGYELLDSLTITGPEIVLVTAKTEYAARAFSYDVADYLVKPLNYSRFLKAVTRVQERLEQKNGVRKTEELYVRTDSRIVKINFSDVLYVEALADYIMIFTKDNKYIVHSTMKGFQGRLPATQFVRVHRSFIINIDKVDAIENLFVVINKKHIPIGASYKENFIRRLNLL